MNCCEYEERIALYVEGDLTAAEASDAERHIASCRECAQLASELRESQAVLKSLSTAVPGPAVRGRVLKTLELRRRRMNWVAIAAALFLILAAGLMWNQQQRTAGGPEVAQRPVEPAVKPEAPAPEPVAQAVKVPKRPRPVRPPHVPKLAPEPERVELAQDTEPLVVKMLTDDPDVVIIWLVDGKESQNDESTFGIDGPRGE